MINLEISPREKCTILIFGISGVINVLLFPDLFKKEIICIPIDGWSIIHLFSTILLRYLIKPTILQYWLCVIGWEVIEQIFCPVMISNMENKFQESYNNILSDLLVAVPGMLLIQQ